ncbi:MAG: type VI secretion system baseplate subunit TssF [Advenella sp.]|nr:type VI secretion system baseplate subunit TssF [Advenella sp.]
MQNRFLDYYNSELAYIREMGKEFAGQYPKIAGRLGMNGIEVADPYVERLLEGFSFLTSRIHMKMDAEFPQFTQRLLEVVYPNYVAPTPSMAVVQFTPNMQEGSLAKGFSLPKGTGLRSRLPKGEQTACEFVTGHDLTLHPIEITSAELTGTPPDLPLKRLNLNNPGRPVQSALRVRIQLRGGQTIDSLNLDQLMFHLNGQDVHMYRLLELLMAHTVAVLCHDTQKPLRWLNRLNADSLKHEGFDVEQSLLPADARVFQGYRIIQEYFAFPARFLFFSLNKLKKGLKLPASLAGEQAQDKKNGIRDFELTFLFDKSMPELEGNISADNLALHCVPVINLFRKVSDRIVVNPDRHEYHLVVDRTRPMDYEVFSLKRLQAYADKSVQPEQEFRSFYESLSQDQGDFGAYYSLRREPRVISETARLNGTRTAYSGSEVFVSLVDQYQAPFSANIRHLGAEVLCTNRDLPMLIPVGSDQDLVLKVSAPVDGIRILRGPSKPRPALAGDAMAWRLISHLGLNHLSLTDLDDEKGAQTLREMLQVYANISDPVIARQISGVRHVRVEPVHHRLPVPGPIVFGRGASIHLELDETAFSGLSPYLFGAVLEQFFARHVSINMMSELVLTTSQHGEIARWKPRMGNRPSV